MYTEIVFFLVLCRFSIGQHLDDAIYSVSSLKSHHKVSEKFLSFTIDPGVLLTGLNLSDSSLLMAKLLSPAFVRIAGPSTKLLKYQDQNNLEQNDSENVIVTPTMWFGINEWLASVNFTPIFGLNDEIRGHEGWDPKETIPLLEIADKFNVSCYWQLGFGCPNAIDLERLQHVLDAFPDKKSQWKLVSRFCPKNDLINQKALVVENPNDLPNLRPKIPLWVTSFKSPHYNSFSSAILWAKEIGDAAQNGFEVILKQPRLYEIYSETPPFWVSFLHKTLMGTNVIDVKATVPKRDVSAYSHCTKHQNDFTKSGAMTIFAINNGTTNQTILFKFGSAFFKNVEVQAFILTSLSEDSTNIFLNEEKLSLNRIKNNRIDIKPKIRRARILNYLALYLPPKSIGFFVLPGAQVGTCINEENDLKDVIEEIQQDQQLTFPVEPRFKKDKVTTLKNLKNLMKKELESDERNHKLKRKEKKIFDLELTSSEIRRVLADRAKTKAAKKNIIFSHRELDEIMDRATRKILKNKNASVRVSKKLKRDASREKKDINMRLLRLSSVASRRKILRQALKNRKSKRVTRDINLDLLKRRSKQAKKKVKKTSEEVFRELSAEIATESPKPGLKIKQFLNLAKMGDSAQFGDFDCFRAFDSTEKKNLTEILEDYDDDSKSELPILTRIGNDNKKSTCLDDSLLDYEFMDNDRVKRSSPKLSFNQKYKSLSDGLKVWKPFDILNLKRKTKRSVHHNMESVENEIENFVKEAKKIQPDIDGENGDYELVFPNKDKISLVENNGDTELKLVLHGDEAMKTNIQKIAKTRNENTWGKLFQKLAHFFQGLSTKLKKYIMDDVLSAV